MAVAATGVIELRPSTGADINGAGFVPGLATPGTDYSQQAAAQYALTGLTTAAANAIILTAAASADMKDNYIQITGGTNFTVGFYQILSIVVGVSITVDRNVTTAAGSVGVGNIGGALQTLGKVHTLLTATGSNTTGQKVWVKAEATIAVGATTTLSPNGGTNSFATQINGYTTTRGDNGQVTLQATSGTGFAILTMQPSGPVIIRNFILDGNSRGTLKGASLLGAFVQAENFKAMNNPSGGFDLNNANNKLIRCVATANGSFGFHMENGNGPNIAIECVAYANTGTGFLGTVWIGIRCISANNTGASTDGFGPLGQNSNYVLLQSCVAYGNGRYGFSFASAIQCAVVFRNCIAYSNSTKDINCAAAYPAGGITADSNAYATQTNYLSSGTFDVILSADPFTNGAGNDFSLNSTAGGGAACRGAGFPGALAAGGTGYLDIGALQHQDTPSTTTVVIAKTVNQFIVEEV